MLLVMWLRSARGHFSRDNHFAFEAAAWYWHFVDVVHPEHQRQQAGGRHAESAPQLLASDILRASEC